jgi:transposase
MRTPDEVAAMQHLHSWGWGTRRIAAEVGCNRETVQRYLAAGAWIWLQEPGRYAAADNARGRWNACRREVASNCVYASILLENRPRLGERGA